MATTVAHSDQGEDTRVLLNGVTCTVSLPFITELLSYMDLQLSQNYSNAAASTTTTTATTTTAITSLNGIQALLFLVATRNPSLTVAPTTVATFFIL